MNDNKLDQIRQRNKIEEMDLKKRQTLFNEFQKAGGQVVNLNQDKPIAKKRNISNINRDKQNSKLSHATHNKNISNPFYSTDNSKKNKQKTKTLVVKKDSRIKLFFARNVCFFANIFNFFGTRFSKKFMEMTLKNIYLEIQTLKTLLDPIFKDNTNENAVFRDAMVEQDCIFEYELVYHAYYMFQDSWFVSLNKTMPVSVDDSEEIFKKIFQQMYIFQSYYKQMQVAVYSIIPKYDNFFNKNMNMASTKKIVNSIFLKMWNEWFLWIEELITYYWIKSNVLVEMKSLIEYLDITPDMFDQVGQLSEKWIAQYHKNLEEELKTESNINVLVFPSKEIEHGIEAIKNKVNFLAYKELFNESKDLRSLFTADDKLFYAYVLLDHFDKEYNGSWNDVNFYIIPGGATGRFDAKKEMKLLINQLHHFYELINEYLRFIKTNNILLQEDKKVNFQYNEKKNKELARKSFDIRKNLAEILDLYVKLLSKIIDSKALAQGIIGNWDEKITIKYANGKKGEKTVESLIVSAYEDANAIVWLLKHSDLSGLSLTVDKMEFLPNTIIESTGDS